MRVVAGTNTEDRTLYFDSLCVFKEDRAPLEFSERPRPGIDLFEGQPLGVNTGKERLPFPTNDDTVIPDSSKNLVKPAFHFYGDSCDFVYEGTDGTLVYEYKPRSGNWSDLTARWNDSAPFLPCDGGGIVNLIGADGATEPVENAELLEFKAADGQASARWTLHSKTSQIEVEYRFKISGKSLVLDTIAKGGVVPEVVFGRVAEIDDLAIFISPYYLYDYNQRPGFGLLTLKKRNEPSDQQEKLFAGAHIDWYRSGASRLRGRGETTALNGGAEYLVKTDGQRNDVYERFVITFSPTFEEVLPTIANPPSPYRHIAGKCVWQAYGASTRDGDKKYWYDVYRHGLRHMIVVDHEDCWRDGGESFTFRTKPAPAKGGDEGWYDYCRFMQDQLGFVYGPYNNFTDFAPVNEYWSPDIISRSADWSLQPAWMRCYAPKPIRAVEYCEKLTPIIAEKFRFGCAYCDVHTSVAPWTRTDYDERVPGAGTFMSVYYPYGEIFLIQKRNWGGPTFSEGPHHCFYAGLVDGNYGQERPYNIYRNPWFVDFDLRKMHDLEVDFGIGNLWIFAPGVEPKNVQEQSELLDRFIAATLAFGHAGIRVSGYGWPAAARSYFMTQQIASYYTQTSADTIRYFDEKGDAFDTSEALERGVVRRSQLCVVYKDGTTVVSNGNKTEGLVTKVGDREVELPPNGYVAWSGDGKVLVESRLNSAERRYDYCESPEYIWFDSRGIWTDCRLARGNGVALCRMLETPGEYEVIPYDNNEVGFKIAPSSDAVSAVALAYDESEIGPALVRVSDGFLFVQPVDGAFSYKVVVKSGEGNAVDSWQTSKAIVEQGETIKLTKGARSVEWTAPEFEDVDDQTFAEGPLGLDSERFWYANVDPVRHCWAEPEQGEFVDVLVVTSPVLAFRFDSDGALWQRRLGGDETIRVDVAEPTKAGPETLTVEANGRRFDLACDVADAFRRYPIDFENELNTPRVFIQRRGQEPTLEIDGSGTRDHVQEDVVCGGVVKPARLLHPPYMGGQMGRAYVEYRLVVPNDGPVAFRLEVGKNDGSGLGDGILYQIAVKRDGSDEEITLAERVVTENEWTPFEAELTPYAGEQIILMVIVDPRENTSGDWACYADLRLESANSFLRRTITGVQVHTEDR
jgi:hypothetical protein